MKDCCSDTLRAYQRVLHEAEATKADPTDAEALSDAFSHVARSAFVAGCECASSATAKSGSLAVSAEAVAEANAVVATMPYKKDLAGVKADLAERFDRFARRADDPKMDATDIPTKYDCPCRECKAHNANVDALLASPPAAPASNPVVHATTSASGPVFVLSYAVVPADAVAAAEEAFAALIGKPDVAAVKADLAERFNRFRAGSADDPDMDATDVAHPAWWRGHEHGARAMVELFQRALRGEVVGGERASLLAAPVLGVISARPLAEWRESDGEVLWWRFPVNEAPYVGSPLCDDWPGSHTHWTAIVTPADPGNGEPGK